MLTLSALVIFVIWLLVACVVWWGGNAIIARINPPQPIGTIAFCVLVLVVCVIVIDALLGLAGHPLLAFR